MADAWGVLTFTKSEDCEIDVKALTDAMNQFKWDNWGGKWECDTDNNLLWYDESTAQYPTVFPQIQAEIYCYSESTDSEYTKSLSEMTADDWNNFEDAEYEDCSLEQIKSFLVPFIKAGWIEIACSSNEKQRYVNFGSLRINANNTATRNYYCSGPQSSCDSFTETA